MNHWISQSLNAIQHMTISLDTDDHVRRKINTCGGRMIKGCVGIQMIQSNLSGRFEGVASGDRANANELKDSSAEDEILQDKIIVIVIKTDR